MSVQEIRKFEVHEQTRGDERRFVIIEYKIVKTEINRYDITVEEK